MNPRDDFITRNLPDHERELCAWFASLIDECVNCGGHVIGWVADRPKGGYTEATVIGLLRHCCEMLDGVAVLTRERCADAAQPNMRSALEAALGLEYIVQEDTERRALAYQVAHAHRKIQSYRRYNPDTEEGRKLRRELTTDIYAPDAFGLGQEWMQELERNLTEMLREPLFIPIEAEWQAVKRGLPKNVDPNWFSLFGGPKTVRQLAYRLNKGSLYEVLFQSWSTTTHAGSVLGRITDTPQGPLYFALRHPADLQHTVQIAVYLGAVMLRKVVEGYCPDRKQEISSWYVAEIKPSLDLIRSGPLYTIEGQP